MSERIKNALMGPFAPHYERARTGSPVVNALAPRQGLERMDLLPMVREHVFNGEDVEAGPWQLGVPQVGADVFNVMMAMRGAPLAGPVPDRATTDQMIGHAGAVVGPMAAGGYARNALAPRGGAELGIFGGRLAKTADHAALAKAEKMAADGVPRDQIWNDTGWFQGVDGKWRFEIDDSGARLDPRFTERSQDYIGSVNRDMPHQALVGAYPNAGEIEMRPGSGWGGEFIEQQFSPGRIVVGRKSADPRSVALHEAQHGVQRMEGFARGGSEEMFSGHKTIERDYQNAWTVAQRIKSLGEKPSQAANYIASAPDGGGDSTKLLHLANKYTQDELLNLAKKNNPYQLYRSLAGEAESRAVQARRDLSADQRRARPPWLDYDVPEADQIVRFR